MSESTKQSSNEAECGNKSKPLLGVVYLSEIAPYSETDFACNGGFYNCPECGEQQYLSGAEIGDTKECECGCKYVIE